MHSPRCHIWKQVTGGFGIVSQVVDTAGDGPLLGEDDHVPVNVAPRCSEEKMLAVYVYPFVKKTILSDGGGMKGIKLP